MAATAKWFGNAHSKAFNKEVSWASDTIKVMLCTSTYVPNQDTHAYKSSVTNEVAAAGSYSAGGATLASKTVAYDTATNAMILDAADVSWAGGSPTARIAVIYVDTGSSATSTLLGYVDFGTDLSVLSIQWDATGILNTAAA